MNKENPRIRLLSDEVIGKIAAGEVVERPAAAIKELVENSLDAGADHITVEIRDGGISYFRVTDNGSGIESRDIRMAFERHATSKITCSEDLSSIGTLGFRGEALASIAAVGRIVCRTKTRHDDVGLRAVCEGGVIQSLEETACPDGTSMEVRDLFFNAPVRLKFLKKPSTEAGLVSEMMVQAILSRPDVAFRYVNQGKTVYQSPGDGKLESAAFCILGDEMLRPTTRKVSGNRCGMVVEGYVGVGESGRGNRGGEHFFINGRYLQSGVLSSGVEEGVKERVMIGRFPMCILHITMPYEAVDVNVHPNKLQVRFQDEFQVQQTIASLVKESLTDPDPFERPEVMKLTEDTPVSSAQVQVIPVVSEAKNAETASGHPASQSTVQTLSGSAATMAGAPASYIAPAPAKESPSYQKAVGQTFAPIMPKSLPKEGRSTVNAPGMSLADAEEKAEAKTGSASFPDITSQTAHEGGETFSGTPDESLPHTGKNADTTKVGENYSFLDQTPKPMRILGAVFHTYILLEYEDQLLMIDQHAAHERLNYESMMKAYDTERAGQTLLVPEIMRVTPRDMEVAMENRDLLRSLGLEMDAMGETELAIRSIPMILGQVQTVQFVRELLDELESEPHTFTLQKRRDAILQTACKHSVKGGESLEEADLRYLAEQLVDQHVTPTCPHGRPLVVALSHAELDRKFRRIQPS